MDIHLNLKKFIEYVDTRSGIMPLMNFEARSVIADEPPSSGQFIPVGQVILYPAFVVFLTEETAGPGAAQWLEEWMQNGMADGDLFITRQAWKNDPSRALADLTDIVADRFRAINILEQALASPSSVFLPAEDIVRVVSGKIGMTHHYITLETSRRKLQICKDYTKTNPVAAALDVFGGWQEPFVTRLHEIVQGSQAPSTRSNGFKQGSRGTVTNKNGDAIYGDDQSYQKEMYYGRVSHGAELLLLDDRIAQDEFGLDIIKVKVLSNQWHDEVGKVAWVGLDATSFKNPDAR